MPTSAASSWSTLDAQVNPREGALGMVKGFATNVLGGRPIFRADSFASASVAVNVPLAAAAAASLSNAGAKTLLALAPTQAPAPEPVPVRPEPA